MSNLVDIYIRSSAGVEERRRAGTYVADELQESVCRAYCKTQGLKVRRVVKELDVSASGKVERVGLNGIIADVKAGKITGLVVYNLSRFARLAPKDQALLLDEVEGPGGKLYSAAENVDVSTPAGRFVRNLFLDLARMRWEEMAEGFDRAKANAVANGKHVTGTTPFGYRRKDWKRKDEEPRDARLDVDPKRGKLVSELFRRRAANEAMGSLARWLDQVSPGGATGSGKWTRATVGRILDNRVYLGEARQGEHVKRNAHKALVDVDTFTIVQALAANREPSIRYEATSLLAGIVRCSCCGHALTRSCAKGYWNYRHRISSDVVTVCPKPGGSISLAKLDAFITEAVFSEALDHVELQPEASDEDRKVVLDELAAAEAKMAPFRDPEYVALIGVEEAKLGAAKVRDEIAELEVKLADFAAPVEPVDLVKAREAWDTLTVDERREVIGSVITDVLVSAAPRSWTPIADRVEIVWRGQVAPVARPSRRGGRDKVVDDAGSLAA